MRLCPGRFQDRINRVGGLNRYGQPNFRLAWSQTETMRAGGVWPDEQYAGYRQVYLANCSPHMPKDGYWMLLEWQSPEQFVGENTWRFLHRDETTGLCTLGPYPRKGRYEIATKLIWTMLVGNKMLTEPWPLNSAVIEQIMPTILNAKKVSIRKRREFAAAEKQREDSKRRRLVGDMLHDAKRRLLPSQIDDRVRLMEKQWAQFLKRRPRGLRRGIQVSSRP